MKLLDLIGSARILARSSRSRRPKQSDLKRALSTAYYAVFHQMCRNGADCLIGTASADRSNSAWQQAYRAIDHGFATKQCKDRRIMRKFPNDIQDFGNCFVDLQLERHRADYDPAATFARTDVITWIDAADVAIRAFRAVPIKVRRAFAAWVTLKSRSA